MTPLPSHEFAAYVPGLVLFRLDRDPTLPAAGEGAQLPAVAVFADIAGSTRIATQLDRLGRLVGPEEMCRILNDYYGPLVSLLQGRGGDVVGFAGDAVMAVWPATGDGNLGRPTRQATEAALEAQRHLNNLELAEGVRLSLRICIGAGQLRTALVGGCQGFWQLVAYGPPMDQIRDAGNIARVGEVFLSREACEHLGGAEVEREAGGGAFVRRLDDPPPRPAPEDIPRPAVPEHGLRPFVPRAVQESIDARQGEFLDQSRTVTTLFVRVARPTGAPPQWERMQEAMAVLQDAMARAEGTVVQLMEDDKGLVAVLAFGLPPVAHEDDAARAVDAAVFLRDLARARGVACGIGISTGLPFCGPLGAEDRRVYTVTGADVIRAARLMQLARDGEILCDQPTRSAARKSTPHRFAPLPRFTLKGFDAPVRVFQVTGPDGEAGNRVEGAGTPLPGQSPDDEAAARFARARARADRLGDRLAGRLRELVRHAPREVEQEFERLLADDRLVNDHGVCELAEGAGDPTAPAGSQFLVGREAERQVIARALEQSAGGQSRVLLVEGETGAGKSRLCEEMCAMAGARGGLVHTAYCSAVETATPYFPWRAVFDDRLGLRGLVDPAERSRRVVDALRGAPPLRPFAPLLNDLLGLALPEEGVVAQLAGQTRADNLHDVLVGLLAATAGGRPTLIQIEDAQWADTASWRLAKLVRERVGRVVVALSVRRAEVQLPAEHALFAEADWTDRLTLGGLPETDAREMVRARLGAARVTDELGGMIWQRTQGNPLFIEQIVDHMAATGLVEVLDGTAGLRAAARAGLEPAVPDTLRGLVTSRLDRLRPPHQLTAKVASVVGPQFPGRALLAVHPDRSAGPALADHITVLVGERVLRPDRPAPDPTYDFPHPILHQVSYELLPRPQRQRLHRGAAEWFESDRVGGGPVGFRLIAYHWGRAGVSDKQAEYLARAGDAALRDGAFREAVTGFTELLRLSHERFRAVPPAGEVARRAHWQFQLGEAYFGLGELPAAAEHLFASLALRARPRRASTAGLVLDTLTQVIRQVARRLWPRRRAGKGAGPDTRETAATYLRLGRISYYTNEILAGTNAVLRALNLAEVAGPSPELATAYASVMMLTGLLNWHRAARVYARLAEAVAREVGQFQNTALVLCYLCMYHLGRGGWERVETFAREALDLAERLGDHHQCGEVATILAMLSCFRAEYRAAEHWAGQVRAAAAKSGNTMHAAWAMNIEGECHLRLGRAPEAASRLAESAAALRGKKDRTEEVRIQGMLAALAVRAGDLNEAGARADAAEAVAAEASTMTCSTLEGVAGVAEARFARAEAEPGNAPARLAAKRALGTLRKYARMFPIGRPRAAVYEARMHHLMGTRAKAVRACREGLDHAHRLQMPFDTALLHAALARYTAPGSPESREHRTAAAGLYGQLGMAFEAVALAGAGHEGPT